MKKLAILLVCCWATPVHAITLFYEGFNPRPAPDSCPVEMCHGFNYADGEQLAYSPDPDANSVPNGQYNEEYGKYWRFATAGTSTAPGIGSGSLSVTGLPASVGNMAQWSMSTSTPHLARTEAFAPAMADGNSWYYSGILRISNVAAWTNTNTNVGGGVFLLGFNDGAGQQATTPSTFQGALTVAKNTLNTSQYFVSTGTTNNGSTFDTNVPLNDGDSVFIVVAYDKIAGTNADRARLWINPASSKFGDNSLTPAPNVDAGFVSGTQRTPRSFMLRNAAQGAAGDRPLVQFDELRIATTWAEATGATVAPSLLGDFNGDGKVDAGDYATWRKNDGTNNALANDNGLGTPVGTAHYDLWRANFGNPPGAGSSSGENLLVAEAVPEPASLAFVLGAVMTVFSCNTRPRSS